MELGGGVLSTVMRSPSSTQVIGDTVNGQGHPLA